jgi:N-methylhydantoinase A
MQAQLEHSEDVCVGIDVGGTFTDAVLTDGSAIWRAKSPTTSHDLSEGVMEACGLAAARAGHKLEDLLPRVSRFGLGTTAVTNTLATRSGRAIGLVTTAGFEDQIPLAKGRKILDDGWVTHPQPIVPRRQIVGVHERIDRDGKILTPLDTDAVVAAARRLIEREGVEAVAISFLWSFRNPVHEELAVEAIRQVFPDLPVFSSAAVNPVMREFERTTSALLNAYVGGAFAGIDALADKLASGGLKVPLLLVHSGGGSISAAEARRVPLGLAMSGPAAGVSASASTAEASQLSDVIACDMGGTSFDVSVISHGVAGRRMRGDLFGIWTATPQIDIESIGAGGGSIGWADARGMLRVGPKSAGAVPGPACYGKGGTEPTVTDALVVLGYIDPARFLGGEMALDVDAAHAACECVGDKLGLAGHEVAWGIRQLALDGMIKATRSLLNARGLDPRQHAVISYGGCGSLFTAEIAAAIGAQTVIVPELASVLCAFGAATADIRRERMHSLGLTMPVDAEKLQQLAAKLEASVLEDLAADGVTPDDCSVSFEADLRFRRQISELPIRFATRQIDDAAIAELVEKFRAEYAKRYGQGSIVLGAGMEFVTLRAIGLGRTVRASLDLLDRSRVQDGTVAAAATHRRVQSGRDIAEAGDIQCFDGSVFLPGHSFVGPALVDGADTTIWVPSGMRAHVDPRGALRMEACQ